MHGVKQKCVAAVSAGALLLSMILSVSAEKEPFFEEEAYKQESVHVTANAGGKPEEVEVEVTLLSGTGSTLPDRTTLTDIRNTQGEETYASGSDGNIQWENKGEDIHYKGYGSSEKLPIDMDIRYTLDGMICSPQGLAGKSGHLVMRFDYKNKLERTVESNGKTKTVPVPLTVITLVPLDEEVFSNVSVTNGELMRLGDSGMAIGVTLPGVGQVLNLDSVSYTEDIEIPEYFEISADVTDFSLDFTATMVSTGLMDDLKEEDLELDENLDGTAGDIDSAVDTMFEAVDKLKNAVDQIGAGMDGIIAALDTGKENLSAQNKNLGRLFAEFMVPEDDEKTPEIDESLTTVAGQIEAARKAAEAAGDEEALARLEDAQKMIEELKTKLLPKIQEENMVAAAYVGGAADGSSKLKEAVGQMGEAVNKFRDGITQFQSNGSRELKKLSRDADKMQDILDTVKALRAAGKEYTNFSGLPDGKTGSVTFLYETAEIKSE